jgi:hypothetical protein
MPELTTVGPYLRCKEADCNNGARWVETNKDIVVDLRKVEAATPLTDGAINMAFTVVMMASGDKWFLAVPFEHFVSVWVRVTAPEGGMAAGGPGASSQEDSAPRR